MADRTYSRAEVVGILRGVAAATEAAWNSPRVQEARAKAHATLDKVATLPPAEQEAYWGRVSAKLREKTEALRREREADDKGKR
jgi:hypothetical protein